MNDAITSQYVAMQQSQVRQNASMAVLKSSIDTATQQGENVGRLINSAGTAQLSATDQQVQQALAITDPAMGQAIDLKA